MSDLNDEPQIGSEAWLARIFTSEARDPLFARHQPRRKRPVLVLLGGQPAAGKTQVQRTILAGHPADDLVEVTGDDLRRYHPDYDRLAREAPFLMPNATASVSGGLVRFAVEHAYDHHYSLLLEGTFRDAGMVTRTATRFAEAGYQVEVAAVATPAVVSRLSAEMRSLAGGYPRVGRWTPPAAHESALEHSPGVVAALEALPHVVRVQVFSREQCLYDNTRARTGAWERPVQAAAVLRAEQHRRLTGPDAVAWLNDYAGVFALAAARPGYLGPETAPAYLRLQADAETMLHSLTLTPGASMTGLRAEQSERHTHLRRTLPPELMPGRSAAPPEQTFERGSHASRQEPPVLDL